MTTPNRIDEILSEMDRDQELTQSLRERILGEEYSSLAVAVAQNQDLIIG